MSRNTPNSGASYEKIERPEQQKITIKEGGFNVYDYETKITAHVPDLPGAFTFLEKAFFMKAVSDDFDAESTTTEYLKKTDEVKVFNREGGRAAKWWLYGEMPAGEVQEKAGSGPAGKYTAMMNLYALDNSTGKIVKFELGAQGRNAFMDFQTKSDLQFIVSAYEPTKEQKKEHAKDATKKGALPGTCVSFSEYVETDEDVALQTCLAADLMCEVVDVYFDKLLRRERPAKKEHSVYPGTANTATQQPEKKTDEQTDDLPF